ncbi:MAG: hypothetical protein JST85_23865 [Acidobacteria bacterium]|nr:hypothetical protein [Acidobacteriota bacterium]
MESNLSVVSDNLKAHEAAKKVYQCPELVLYGNLSEITQAIDMMGMADGGMGMTNKT